MQCLLLSFHQDRIARYYYFENYVQSRDSLAFFEYVYHRVSSIRYLTKLVLLQAIVAHCKDPEVWTRVGSACVEALQWSAVPGDHLDVKEGEIGSFSTRRRSCKVAAGGKSAACA